MMKKTKMVNGIEEEIEIESEDRNTLGLIEETTKDKDEATTENNEITIITDENSNNVLLEEEQEEDRHRKTPQPFEDGNTYILSYRFTFF